MPSSPKLGDRDSEVSLLSENQCEEQQYRLHLDVDEPQYTRRPQPKRSLINRYSWIIAGVLVVLFTGLLAIPKPRSQRNDEIDDDYDYGIRLPESGGLCKQHEWKKIPNDHISKALEDLLDSKDFEEAAARRLSGAVQIPTESFDDMGPVGEDPRWTIFYEFHHYLQTTYPLV